MDVVRVVGQRERRSAELEQRVVAEHGHAADGGDVD